MTSTYGSNLPPLARPAALVTGIAFGTELIGAVVAGLVHPAAGLGALVVGLMGALCIQHILWLAEEGDWSGAYAYEVESSRDGNVLPARRV